MSEGRRIVSFANASKLVYHAGGLSHCGEEDEEEAESNQDDGTGNTTERHRGTGTHRWLWCCHGFLGRLSQVSGWFCTGLVDRFDVGMVCHVIALALLGGFSGEVSPRH